ncbi:SEC-C metal-binding domain-containing protein [Leptospira interrogans]
MTHMSTDTTKPAHDHSHDHSHDDGCGCGHDHHHHDHGHHHHPRNVAPYVRTSPKVGRNDPCPCGSGKKHKKCCLAA